MTGQPTIITTDVAAEAVGVAPNSFRKWAQRRKIRAVRHERRGRSTVALWDLDEIYAATRDTPGTRVLERAPHL